MSLKDLMAKAANAEAELNLPGALEAYEAALALAPESLDIAGRLAALAFRLNQWPMAEKLFAHLITHGQHETETNATFAAA